MLESVLRLKDSNIAFNADAPLSSKGVFSLKLAVVGSEGVGKRTFLRNYSKPENTFDEKQEQFYRFLGSGRCSISCNIGDSYTELLSLGFNPGMSDPEDNLKGFYEIPFEDVRASLLVFDVSEPITWEYVRNKWGEFVKQKSMNKYSLFVGNRSDLVSRDYKLKEHSIEIVEIIDYVKKNDFLGYVETVFGDSSNSAKPSGYNVCEMIGFLSAFSQIELNQKKDNELYTTLDYCKSSIKGPKYFRPTPK